MSAFQDYYLSVFTEKYAQFEGTANRREFWMYTLFNVLVVILFYFIDTLIFRGRFYLFLSIYGLIKFVPELALSVRRLHDIGKSGYTLLWGLLPIIGAIYLIILFCMEGTSCTSTPKTTHQPKAQTLSASSTKQQPTNPGAKVDDIRKKWEQTTTANPSTQTKSSSSSSDWGKNADSIRNKW